VLSARHDPLLHRDRAPRWRPRRVRRHSRRPGGGALNSHRRAPRGLRRRPSGACRISLSESTFQGLRRFPCRGRQILCRPGWAPGPHSATDPVKAKRRVGGGVGRGRGPSAFFERDTNAAEAPREPAVTDPRRAIAWTPGPHERWRYRSRSGGRTGAPPGFDVEAGSWNRRAAGGGVGRVQRVDGGKGVCGGFRDTHRCGSLRRHDGGPCRATDPQRGLQPDLRCTTFVSTLNT
jgi:hypothetical protein